MLSHIITQWRIIPRMRPFSCAEFPHPINTISTIQLPVLSLWLLNNSIVLNNVLRELSGRNTTSIQAVNIVISPVLGLRLEPEETSKNKDLSTNKQEHDLSTPVQLIRVDEVWEYRRKHKSSQLLADKTEGNSLGTSSLGSSLLSNSPTETTDSSSIEHRPCDHECEEGGVGGVVTGADH